MRRVTGFVLAALAASLPGAAQTPTPTLHRFIPGDQRFSDLPPGIVAAPQSAEDFQRLAGATARSDAPPGGAEVLRARSNWEPVSRTMDEDTHSPPGATLRYREVFTPSVSPFKRTHAFDAVDELGRMAVRDPSSRLLRVGDVPAAWSREHVARFTGDVMVELVDGALTPIPSVAAEEAVLSYHTEPDVPVAFARDSAGNLYVRAEQSRTVRLEYMLVAPEHAFVAPMHRLPTMAPGGPSFHGASPRPAVTPAMDLTATQVLNRLGLHRSDAYNRVLDALVGYFRGFRDDDLAPSRESLLYARLALGGVGACRHRAYAMMVTLHALGVPARYVGNEAHAWVEVVIPGVGWSRIDLGGWNVNFREDNPNARDTFQPENPDPFQRPAGYENGYSTRPTGTVAGGHHGHRDGGTTQEEPSDAAVAMVSDDSDASVPNPQEPTNPAPDGGSGHGGGGATSGGGGGRGGGITQGTVGVTEATTDNAIAPTARPVERGNAAPGEPEVEPLRTTLRFIAVRASTAEGDVRRGVVRGTMVVCEGEAHDETGAPVPNLPVAFELLQGRRVLTVVRDGRRESALGTVVTNADGVFRTQVLLPLDLEAGTYAIRARTPGDARHAPAQVE